MTVHHDQKNSTSFYERGHCVVQLGNSTDLYRPIFKFPRRVLQIKAKISSFSVWFYRLSGVRTAALLMNFAHFWIDMNGVELITKGQKIKLRCQIKVKITVMERWKWLEKWRCKYFDSKGNYNSRAPQKDIEIPN